MERVAWKDQRLYRFGKIEILDKESQVRLLKKRKLIKESGNSGNREVNNE